MEGKGRRAWNKGGRGWNRRRSRRGREGREDREGREEREERECREGSMQTVHCGGTSVTTGCWWMRSARTTAR
jgi:hypothetical protein